MLLLRWLGRCLRCTLAPRRTPAGPARVSVEPLEERALPSGLPFRFVIDDPGHQFARFPLLRSNLEVAGQILSSHLQGKGSIEVRVRPNNSIPRSDGSTVGVRFAGSASGLSVYESAALAEAQTGVDPNGSSPEVELDFNTRDYLPHAWFDPSGAARTAPLPASRTDFISVALHETLHALGFQGYRTISGWNYGSLRSNLESSFDALTSFGRGAQDGILYFHGRQATAVYGGSVPLTSVGAAHSLDSQNFYHVGNPSGRPGANLIHDLMNGMVFATGTRYTISRLDLAMLNDMGWIVNGLPAPPVPRSVAAPVAPPAPPLPPRPGRSQPGPTVSPLPAPPAPAPVLPPQFPLVANVALARGHAHGHRRRVRHPVRHPARPRHHHARALLKLLRLA